MGKTAVMIVHCTAELAQSYIAHARCSRVRRPRLARSDPAIQKVLRAIHSRIRESTTTHRSPSRVMTSSR